MTGDASTLSGARQHGMTVIAVLMILIIIAFVALIVMRIVPIYINYFSIISTLEGIKSEPEIERMTVLDIQRAIQRRFDISYVSVIDARQVKIRLQGRERLLDVAYEDRRPLIANLDVVAKFNDTIVLSAAK